MGNETKSRFRLGSKISSIVLSVAMLATTFTGLGSTLVPQTSITVNAAGNYGLADNIQDGNILHCFCWKYDDIKDMLPEIAEAGFTSVQVSPPQATAGTGAWWWFYQPLGFYIGSNAMGNEQSLKALCSEAHNYGIKIIADVVANHLAGDHSNIQDDLKDGQYWHSEQYNADDGDRYRVTHGKIGMPDLATENSHVQDCVIKYLAQLKSAGVDGIRFDAAKHIGLPSEGDQFWARVTASTDLWSYGEILNNPGISLDEGASTRQQAINVMKEYSNYIGITDSVYGKLLRDELAKGKFPDSPSVYAGAWMGIANTRLVYWGESHDTWSNNDDWGSSRNVDQNVIDRAYAIAGSRNHIAALYLSRPFSKDKDSIMIGAKGSTHFTSKEVAAVNHYKNALNGQDDYYTTGGGCGVVCRAGGAVVALASGGNTDVTVPNGGGTVTPGTYTDEISGSTWTVTATQMTGHIGESGIAVFYKGGAVGGSVSASPASGTSFTDTLSVTLSASDATNLTYSTSEGASGSFTNGQKITIGASTAVGGKVTLTLKGTGKDGSALSETYTYTKKDPNAKVCIYMDNSSYNWSSVYAYVYDESSGTAKSMAAWPGVKMTDKNSAGYFKLDVSGYENGQVIFNDGTGSATNRYPADMQPGLKIGGTSKLFSAGNKWADYSDVVVPPPTKDPDVTVDKASGTSFTTETLDITLSLANATKGTYSIDNGPEKEFTTTTKVAVGEGKIADTDVTVKVTATDGSKTTNKTLTYTKKYVKKTTSTSAGLASVYQTNPSNGKGKQATITIDGKVDDWSEDMMIAQGAAWDCPNHWKGGHENCLLDTYALFAAWDDTNLYIGCQMVNTTDTWQKPGEASLMDGAGVGNVPQILALSIDPSSPTMTNMEITTGKPIWSMGGVKFTTHVDRLLYMSGQAGQGKPSMFAPADAEGNTDYTSATACIGFADGGIEYKMARANICSKITGLNDSQSPDDVFDDNADWVDYKTYSGSMGTHSTAIDTFYEIKIPLATLGITKDYLTTKGIGAMWLATRGESPMDCVPFDPSMLDNTMGDYFAGDNTSKEKEDVDIITVSLAQIGAGSDTPVPPPTELPLQVNFGTDRSAPQLSTTAMTIKGIGYGGKSPYKYEFSVDGKVIQASSATATVAWTPKTSGQHTLKCVITDSTGKSATAAKTFTSEGGNPPVPGELTNDSSLSATTIAANGSITMNGAASGGTSPYTYAYLYKSSSASSWTTVKAYSSATSASATISAAGSYQACIKVKDSTGTEVKKFIDFTVTGGGVTNNSTVSPTTVTLGNAVTVKCSASGGKSPYKYAVLYKASSASSWTTKQDFSTNASVSIKFTGEGKKDICVKVKDNAGNISKKYFTVTVKAAALTNNSTVSATSIALGSTIKATAKATGGTSPYTYQIVYKKSTQSSWTTASAYSTTATANIKPSSTGAYQICIKVKDKKGTEVKKFFDITVKEALVNNSTLSATSIKLGDSVTVKGAAKGGTGYYNFAVLYKKSADSKWTTAQAYKSNTTVTFKPASATTYDVCVKVKDSAGTEVKKYFTVKVTSNALANNSTVSATSVALGNAVTVKCAASGGKSSYKYAVYYKASSSDTWSTKQDFSTTTSVSIKFSGAGKKDICVKVKDSAGTVAKKYFTVTVTANTALANTSTVSATSVTLGNSITVKCAATGGKSPYKYAVYYKASSSDTWTEKQAFSTTASASIKFSGKGTKDVCVKVKDNAGTVVKKYFTITVK